MATLIELTGASFGRLSIIKQAENIGGRTAWKCKCDCGRGCVVRGNDLRQGRQVSCGHCRQSADNGRFSHGHAVGKRSRTYRCWASMLSRCNNSNFTQYSDYGGRGICVAETWQDFATFLKDMGECPEGMTIDREDNNGNYCKENCRWATRIQQNRNRRDTPKLSYQGVTQSVPDWAEQLGVHRKTIYRRLRSGLPVEQVLSTGRVQHV